MEDIELNNYDKEKKEKRKRIIITSIISVLVVSILGLTSF